MINKIMIGCLIFLILMPTCALFAKEVGTFGETYPILEEDLLQFIQKRISKMQENGEWREVQNQMQQKAKNKADRPKSISNITKSTMKREWLFDPTITLSHDLKDHEGRVFARKGTTFNPLKIVSLKNTLIFFDGDDEMQVEWVKKKVAEFKSKTKLILIHGSVIDSEKTFHQKIYFDQEGKLTRYFYIEHVPTIVTQNDLKLKVMEDVL